MSHTLWWGYPWPDVLTGIGTTALAVFAVGTIVATIWIAHRDRKAAEARFRQELNEAGARESARRARETAVHLGRVLIEEWPKVMGEPGTVTFFQSLQAELTIGLPQLDDPDLIKRVEDLLDALVELAS